MSQPARQGRAGTSGGLWLEPAMDRRAAGALVGGGCCLPPSRTGMKAEPEDATEHSSPQVWLRSALGGGSQGGTYLSPVTHRVLLWPLAHFILLTVQHRWMDAGTQRRGVHRVHPNLGSQFSPAAHSASVAQACLVVRVVGLLLEGGVLGPLLEFHRCGLGRAWEYSLARAPRGEMGSVGTCSAPGPQPRPRPCLHGELVLGKS